MRRSMPLAFLLGLLAVPLASPAFAQRQLGAIQGTIVDATGSVLPGVTVTATNKGTGEVRTTVANEVGIYRLQSLDPGTYDLVVFAHSAATNSFAGAETVRVIVR